MSLHDKVIRGMIYGYATHHPPNNLIFKTVSQGFMHVLLKLDLRYRKLVKARKRMSTRLLGFSPITLPKFTLQKGKSP
jgi:hypothetical protein